MKCKYILMFGMLQILTLPAYSALNFASYTAHSVGSSPEVVAIGDINNDGLNDVVLGTSFYFDSLNDYKVFVFIQDSAGNLKSPVKYDGGDITSMDIGDLNADGLQDIVIGYDDSVGIFFQNSSGICPMVSYYSGTKVNGVKIGDLNNDTLLDIAVCHWNEDSIRIFIQRPSGIFDSSVAYHTANAGYDEIDIGDVTGDGLEDVVFMRGSSTNDNFEVFAQDSTGSLKSPVSYDLGGDENTHGIAVKDINNDGKKDVVASYGGNSPTSNIAVWLQDSAGVLKNPAISYACHDCPEPVEIADLDNDSLNDVIVANGGWNTLSIYLQNDSNNLRSYINVVIPYASHYKPEGLAIGDINDDNKPDIAIADYNNGLVILKNTTTGVEEPLISDFGMRIAELKAYPNPFVGNTVISYSVISYSGNKSTTNNYTNIRLTIHDISGRTVKTLVDGEKEAGSYTVNLDAKELKTGIYFVRLDAGSYSETKKITVIR
ncbi:MAG: FG-GAP-like repeat-containing protein [bacterium]|nr:FG-GAP-like repeat-containing protein [bacterium]